MADFPSGPIERVEGRALVVAGEDIDTDRIIPARFLKCVSFDALGEQAFADDRKELDGAHPFDQPQFQGASILVVNGNFGCGSSREHAPQALMRWGIRAGVGVSFAEIFFGNCLALGIPCTTAAPDQVLSIQAAIQADPSRVWTLDLEVMKFSAEGESWIVSLADGPGEMLRSGRWDATSQLLVNGPQVDALMERMPYLNGFQPAI